MVDQPPTSPDIPPPPPARDPLEELRRETEENAVLTERLRKIEKIFLEHPEEFEKFDEMLQKNIILDGLLVLHADIPKSVQLTPAQAEDDISALLSNRDFMDGKLLGFLNEVPKTGAKDFLKRVLKRHKDLLQSQVGSLNNDELTVGVALEQLMPIIYPAHKLALLLHAHDQKEGRTKLQPKDILDNIIQNHESALEENEVFLEHLADFCPNLDGTIDWKYKSKGKVKKYPLSKSKAFVLFCKKFCAADKRVKFSGGKCEDFTYKNRGDDFASLNPKDLEGSSLAEHVKDFTGTLNYLQLVITTDRWTSILSHFGQGIANKEIKSALRNVSIEDMLHIFKLLGSFKDPETGKPMSISDIEESFTLHDGANLDPVAAWKLQLKLSQILLDPKNRKLSSNSKGVLLTESLVGDGKLPKDVKLPKATQDILRRYKKIYTGREWSKYHAEVEDGWREIEEEALNNRGYIYGSLLYLVLHGGPAIAKRVGQWRSVNLLKKMKECAECIRENQRFIGNESDTGRNRAKFSANKKFIHALAQKRGILVDQLKALLANDSFVQTYISEPLDDYKSVVERQGSFARLRAAAARVGNFVNRQGSFLWYGGPAARIRNDASYVKRATKFLSDMTRKKQPSYNGVIDDDKIYTEVTSAIAEGRLNFRTGVIYDTDGKIKHTPSTQTISTSPFRRQDGSLESTTLNSSSPTGTELENITVDPSPPIDPDEALRQLELEAKQKTFRADFLALRNKLRTLSRANSTGKITKEQYRDGLQKIKEELQPLKEDAKRLFEINDLTIAINPKTGLADIGTLSEGNAATLRQLATEAKAEADLKVQQGRFKRK